MRIDHLELAHFKRHSHLDLRFAPGLNLLVGPNYAGKSSALQAILMAFFGVSCVPGGLAVAVRDGSKATQLSIRCRFHWDRQDYTLERTHKGATLLEGDSPLARGHTAVNARVAELLGQDGKTFQRLHTLRQGEAGELLGLSGSELTALVETLLGIDLIDRVLRRGRDRIQFLQGQLAGGESVDADRLADLKAHAQAQARRHQQRQQALTRTRKREATLEAAFEQADRQYKDALSQHGAHARFIDVKKRLDREQVRLHDRRASLEEARAALEMTDLSELAQAIKDAREQLLADAAYQREADALETERAHVNRTGMEFLRAFKAVTVPTPPAAQALETARAALEDAQHRLGQRTAAVQAARFALESGRCQACKRPFEGVETPEVLESQLAAAEAADKDARKALSHARDRVDAIERSQTQSTAARQEKSRLRQQLNECTQRWKTLTARLRALPARLDLTQRRELLAQAEAWEAQSTRLRELKAETAAVAPALAEVERQLQALDPVDPVDPAPFEKEAARLQHALRAAREARHAAHLEKEESQREADGADAEYTRLARQYAQAQETAAQLDRYQRLMKLLKSHREQFLEQAWQRIYSTASAFVATVTEGDVSGIENGKAGLTYIESGRPRPLAAASGAQRDLLGLALKLALSENLGGASCLLLDEPTGAMKDELAVALMVALRAEGRQVLAVTHRLYDTSVADAAFEFERGDSHGYTAMVNPVDPGRA